MPLYKLVRTLRRYNPCQTSAIIIDITCDNLFDGIVGLAVLPLFIDRVSVVVGVGDRDGSVFVGRADAGQHVGRIVAVDMQSVVYRVNIEPGNRQRVVPDIVITDIMALTVIFYAGFVRFQYPVQRGWFIFIIGIGVG